MSRLGRIITTACVMFLASARAPAAQTEGEPLKAADRAKQVEAIVQPLVDADAIVGCVVGIVDHGRTEIYSFGETKRGSGERPDGDTLYEIGSITKAFTGILLADMINRGLLRLDAPVQDFLPKGTTLGIADGKPITLLNLATHTAGLPPLPTNMSPKVTANPYADYTSTMMYRFLDGYTPLSQGIYAYSNFGMGLLGQIIANKSGKNYETFVIERICGPLGMSDTRIRLAEAQRERLAPPYDAELKPSVNWDYDALAPCGAIRSSANDLLKLLAAGMADDDRPVVKAIHEAWKKHHDMPNGIGVGLAWHVARDGVSWWHNGQTAGYGSAVFAVPVKQLGVVVLMNTGTDITLAVAERIVQSAIGMSPKPLLVRKAINVSPEELKQYEGIYAFSLFAAITVTLEDGKLLAQLPGQDKFQLFAESEAKFFYKVVDAQITFARAADGKAYKLILHQNGIDQTALRIK